MNLIGNDVNIDYEAIDDVALRLPSRPYMECPVLITIISAPLYWVVHQCYPSSQPFAGLRHRSLFKDADT
jgi:hypothetical protein